MVATDVSYQIVTPCVVATLLQTVSYPHVDTFGYRLVTMLSYYQVTGRNHGVADLLDNVRQLACNYGVVTTTLPYGYHQRTCNIVTLLQCGYDVTFGNNTVT